MVGKLVKRELEAASHTTSADREKNRTAKAPLASSPQCRTQDIGTVLSTFTVGHPTASDFSLLIWKLPHSHAQVHHLCGSRSSEMDDSY